MLINPKNDKVFASLESKLPQSLILSTPDHDWGQQIAQQIATNHQFDYELIFPVKNEEIDLKGGRIGVEQVRQLTTRTRTHQAKKRVYIFYKADSLTEQAQNALLKIFEEPNQSTYFVLLVKNQRTLLPTIISRSQYVHILPLTRTQAESLISETISTAIKQQILFLAEGNPLTIRYLSDKPEKISEYAKTITDAKELLRADSYNRIILLNKYKDSREDAILMLEALIRILHTSIKSADPVMLGLLKYAMKAREDLKANYNVRLTLIYHLA